MRRSTYAASEFSASQQKYGRDSIGGITSSPLHQRRNLSGAKTGARGVRQQQRRHLRAGLPFADRLWLEDKRSANPPAPRDFDSVMQADVIMVIGANPTDAHPVFASQMKRRLREGARLIVIDPRTHRSGATRRMLDAELSPAPAPGHQRRHDQRAGPRHRHRRLGQRGPSSTRAARTAISTTGANSSAAARKLAGSPGRDHAACPPRISAPPRVCMPPAAMRRSITGSASPSTARASRWSWASPTSRWPPATSAAKAWA